MICPNCSVQMHQKDKIGGGRSTDECYETWTVQECPTCGRLVHEIYIALVIEPENVEQLMMLSKKLQ